ncbi:uncharacterized protein EHS24_008801 [Apiotrichum porosum]|uniref:Uncharacterized protein n=1 Tax=Apiotrichum porosum TaxID=105984 RepID=A0A427XN48_9TREE|nr:uncharacterized protein EHS24_008801 [Apiotrichum porosum]RSH80228.1 hypothetical protein EHS24_008801 [Apiotrichum porosum]
MGYAILMQWTTTVPPGPRTNISDLVLSRVLEHYNITHPMRSSVQLRTFRAMFPEAITPASAALGAGATPPAPRLLTTITYSLPIPPVRDVPVPLGARDDTTYLFLEDRGIPAAAPATSTPAGATPVPTPTPAAAPADPKANGTGDKDGAIEIKDTLEDDGFEIVDVTMTDGEKPAAGDAATATTIETALPAVPAAKQAAPPAPRREKYKILAVKPATLVMPTLHNLLSPFVLGLSKSARAAASTTAQAAAPTPLTGTPLILTTLAFPPTAHPHPSLSLSVHILPNANAQTIFLEGEWDGAVPAEAATSVLKEFLLGCVPEGVAGDARFMSWEGADECGLEGWTSVEKTRRMTMLLTRALRESQFI